MTDSVSIAYGRMRRSQQIHDIYLDNARHMEAADIVRAEDARQQAMADCAVFQGIDPITVKEVTLKAKEAINILKCCGETRSEQEAGMMLQKFFHTRKTIDVSWLRDLRYHTETVAMMAPTHDYALSCLRSITAGMGRPRLAWQREPNPS
jgi:hypothetical protein